jgi:hypothetical protein
MNVGSRRGVEFAFAKSHTSGGARATALPEFWALVAEHSGLAGAWRLTGVCVAAREGAKEWLRTLPGLVVCGGLTSEEDFTSEMSTETT